MGQVQCRHVLIQLRVSLFGVTEVTFGTDVAYFVKMQDSKNWITVKMDAFGDSSIYEKYKKR